MQRPQSGGIVGRVGTRGPCFGGLAVHPPHGRHIVYSAAWDAWQTRFEHPLIVDRQPFASQSRADIGAWDARDLARRHAQHPAVMITESCACGSCSS